MTSHRGFPAIRGATMGIAGYVQFTLRFEREGSKWVGTCLDLGTSTYGRTLDQVHDALKKLVLEHLDLLEEAEERVRFFEEHGIKVHPTKPESHEISIPGPWADPSLEALGPLFQPGVFPVEEPHGALASA